MVTKTSYLVVKLNHILLNDGTWNMYVEPKAIPNEERIIIQTQPRTRTVCIHFYVFII